MKFQHVFRHMLPTDTLKDFVEPRLSKFDQFVADNTIVRATYEHIHNDFNVKIKLLARNRTELVAIETHSNIYVALDKALMKVERQLLKQKEKKWSASTADLDFLRDE